MTLQEKIKADMVAAMKDKNAVRVGVLRGIMAGFTTELVNKKKKPDEALTDEESTAVILRAIKQRKDSIDQFTVAALTSSPRVCRARCTRSIPKVYATRE
jgi:hypothetical protein